MANPDPSRTEKPTAKRLGKERSKGNVLSCPDISSVAVMSFCAVSLLLTIPWVADAFRDILLSMLRIEFRESFKDSQVCDAAVSGGVLLFKILAPACCGAVLMAVIIMRIQVGKFFSFGPLRWRFNVLFNPKACLKELFPSKVSIRNMLIAVAKVSVVGWLLYVSIKGDYNEFLKLGMMPLMNAAMWVVQEAFIMFFKIMALMVAIAAVSYILRRKEYFDNLMMTKQEVKDERRNQEGDPLIKGQIRKKMREIFIRALRANLKQADVVVTNPTHVAVALRYDPEKDPAPMVVAKGLRKRAEHIKFMARAYGIPIVEAPPLARSLYRNVKIAEFIPAEFYRAVAAILAKLHSKGALSKRLAPKKKAPAKAQPLRKAA